MPAGRPAKPAQPPTVNVRLPRALWERLCAAAEASDPRVSAAALAESVLRHGLDEREDAGDREP